ncbi:hypothetical protein [Microbacterium sp.]|uniref:hypothetical protein n=1 Tax=Microbacterium sp. TaxID=51671 RepID=UPI003A8C9C6C
MLLRIVLVSTLVNVAIQVEIARWSISTGRASMEGCNDVPPKLYGRGWISYIGILMFLASLAGIVTKEIDYRSSYRFVDEMDTAIGMLADGLDVSPVITYEFVMDDADQAFRTTATPEASKVLLRLGA